MKGEMAKFKNPPDSTKSDLVEAKADQPKEFMVSTERAKNDNNGKQNYPFRSILNLLLLNILIRIPLCFYDVYTTDGVFSRRFAVFALSATVISLMYTLASKMIGTNNANNFQKWEIHGVSMNHLLMLLNFVIAPLRLHEVYLTDGILSRRFVGFAMCAFSLVLIHLKLSGMILVGPCVVLLPGFIGLSATIVLDLLTMAGSFIFAIIIFYMPKMCAKVFDKKSDGKEISQSG